jgi:hypothetical protein
MLENRFEQKRQLAPAPVTQGGKTATNKVKE